MEDLLLQIVKEATGSKLSNLKNAAQIAYDKLYRQHGLHRDPSYELRTVCLTAIQMALETKRTKFTAMALNGMHRIIKDDRFYVGLEPEDDSVWLPAQLLRSTVAVTTTQSTEWNEDTVVNILRLFLAMACSPNCTLNGRLLIEILSRCGECWDNGSRAIKAASLAAASQCLRTFCAFLKDESEYVLRTGKTNAVNQLQAAAVYNEVIPVMQWLCSRLVEPRTGIPKNIDSSCGTLYMSECILTLTATLPKNVHTNPHFRSFLWQKFCPTLAAALGSPGRVTLDKKFTYKEALHIIENEARGFFTGPGLEGPPARCIYLTAAQLLRIAGAQGTLRPMLEALFHRMLLLPSPSNRTEPLKSIREIFKNPSQLVDLSVILYYDKGQGHNCSDDMALFRLIIDAMEECAMSQQQSGSLSSTSLQSSIECVVALLNSLQTLCSGDIDENVISDEVVDILNNRYNRLRDADYTGPLTYQSMARLPAPYRDVVAEFRQNGYVDTTSESDSDLDGHVEVDVASTASGETEGPEEEPHTSSADDQSTKTDTNWPYLYSETPKLRSDGESDRRHAREFTKSITNELVPKLLRIRTSVEVDKCIQEFASLICQENSSKFSDFDYNLTAINADGIYLATYSGLLLAYQLMKSGHYDNPMKPVFIPLSEQQFVTSVQNCGVLVYLSTFWLCELYQCLITTNPLESIDIKSDTRCPLIDMLIDNGGLGATQMLSDWQRLQSVANVTDDYNQRREAGRKLSRRLLTCCWESIVTILSAGLGDTNSFIQNRLVALSQKTLKVPKRSPYNGDALFTLSLNGLHSAATLSNSLSLQHLAGKILNLLSTNVCESSGPRINASQALSIDVVLSGGLELGSYSPDCWLPVFLVCRHVTQLEHELFSLRQNANDLTTTNPARDYETGEKATQPTIAAGTGHDKLNLTSCPIDDDETCIDVYSFLQAPLQSPKTNILSILKHYSGKHETALLSQSDTAKVLCTLSLNVESLFCNAAERLSLPALCHFLKSLCRSSREQLYRNSNSKKVPKPWWSSRIWKLGTDQSMLPLSLLLHRIGDVTLRVFRSTRPLLHILRVWAITGPHLMDAACHRERSISKRAIEYIHDIITALLVEQSELPYFHFNEAILKPFENLLSMETCDIEVQDQIVACLYEIVEAHRTEIRSGWRPLFGTLRNARNRPLNISNITDIFREFLNGDNTLVFANAGLDCILCLLSYLEISGTNTVTDDGDYQYRPSEFLHETLKFLERCSTILAFMYNMPKCPNFHSTYKIKGITYTHVVDANIPNSMENFTYFGNDYLQNTTEQHIISYRSLHIDKESITKIDELDKLSGVLKVWFLLMDGLTNSLIVCPPIHQSPILQCILKLFKSFLTNPGLDFGFYCINHLLIPMLQDWLRYVNKTHNNWATIERNFKHCCGITTDLVVEFIEKSHHNMTGKTMLVNKLTTIRRPTDNQKYVRDQQQSVDDRSNLDTPTKIPAAATLALKQLLIVLIECAAQPQEAIARVGVSCLKHAILTTGNMLNEQQWMIACSAIHRACTVTIAPLRQLSFAFHEKSNSFYGDCATVKVAARRDSSYDELCRLNILAQQVFLIDQQRTDSNKCTNGQIKSTTTLQKQSNDNRSYSFLLYPTSSSFGQNLENFVIRIPFRNVVIGLLANQILLQLVAKLLLGHLKCVPAEVHGCISDGIETTNDLNLGIRSKEILLRCVKQYLTSSIEFDSRPGLKFLIQKVSNLDYSANLYRQMTSSWMIYYVSMVDSYLYDIEHQNVTVDDLNNILESCSRLNTSSAKKREHFVRHLFSLQDVWNLVCENYLTVTNLGDSLPISDSETTESDLKPPETIESIGVIDDKKPDMNVTLNTLIYDTNPFRMDTHMTSESKTITPEIEQQRTISIVRDSGFKRSSLSQLVIASNELLQSLPQYRSEQLILLMTPTIREAFRLVKTQDN